VPNRIVEESATASWLIYTSGDYAYYQLRKAEEAD